MKAATTGRATLAEVQRQAVHCVSQKQYGNSRELKAPERGRIHDHPPGSVGSRLFSHDTFLTPNSRLPLARNAVREPARCSRHSS